MDVRGVASGTWEIIKLVVLAIIAIGIVVFGIRLLLSNIGQGQPTQAVADAKAQRAVFPQGTECFGTFDDGAGPPCATPQYTFAYPLNQTGPKWCVTLIYLYQRQSDVDALLATDPVFPMDDALNVPYYRATLDGDYCGEFKSYSFNGRNNENDVNGWAWTGPIGDMQDAIRAKVKGS